MLNWLCRYRWGGEKEGVSVNLSDVCYAPLTVSCKREHIRIVQKSIKFGQDINMKIENKTARKLDVNVKCYGRVDRKQGLI